MAEDQKLVIEIDADTQQFTVKMNDVQQTLATVGKSGSDGFSGIGEAAIGLNQALELGAKLMEGVRQALETIDKVEAFDNQRTALLALGNQVGLSAQQINEMLKTMQSASGNTLTTAQATTEAFRLLNAGFKAETIPLITEFAKQISETRPQAGDLNTVMNALANSLEQGTTRGLRQIIPGLKETGDRAATLNAILKAASVQANETGEVYESFGKRMSTSLRESADSAERLLGNSLKNVGIALFGTQTEKAANELKKLKDALDQVNAAQAAGKQNVNMALERADLVQTYTIEQARAILLKQMGTDQANLNAAVKAEKGAIEDNTKAFQQQGEVKKVLDATTTQKLRVQADREMYEQMLNNKEKFEADSENILKGLEKAEKAEIDARFREQVNSLNGELITQKQYKDRFIALEQQHQAALRNIKHKEFDHEQIDNNAAYNLAMTRNFGYAGLAESRAKMEIDAETKAYNKKVQIAAAEIKDEGQKNKKIEQMADQHARAVAAIEDKYRKATTKNFADGWKDAIAKMSAQNNTFAKRVSTTTVGMQHVVSNSFVQMAKDHQFSVSQMLDNMLEFIGESMIEDGVLKLFMGIYPPNPALLATGAAEIAAGAALVGVGGGAQAPTSTTAGSIGIDQGGQQQLSQSPTAQQPQQQATIVINGDLLNSQETVNHLEDMIRKNSDTTGFAIVAQGKQY